MIGIPAPINIKYKTLNDKALELPQASSRSLATAFQDVSAHLVVRNYKFEMKDHITINSLSKAVENQGFIYLQGNQERTKVVTPEGIIVTQGKKEVYHLYVAPKTGSFDPSTFRARFYSTSRVTLTLWTTPSATARNWAAT